MALFERLKNFVHNEAFGGVLLTICMIFALLVQNSFLSDHYRELLNLNMGFVAGEFRLEKPFLLWVNDGLISIFFFAIGLELKKELMQEAFKEVRSTILPFAAALGGIIVPASIFALVNVGGAYTLKGWAIPTATDTAFALAVLTMCGRHTPSSLKIFLLSLAIFDDVGVILIIAVFYTSKLSIVAFIVASCVILALLILNLLGITRKSFYFICSLILRVSILKSGVYATSARLITAFFTPVFTKDDRPFLKEIDESLRFRLAFAILPLFTFADTGVNLANIGLRFIFSGASARVFLRLFVSKQVDVFLFSYLTTKSGLVRLSEGANLKQLYGVCILTGIGSTMSLFIDGLAYEMSDIFNYMDNPSVLVAFFCSRTLGFVYLKFFART